MVAEGHGWFLRRYDPQRALQFLAFVNTLAGLSIVSVGDEEIASAAAWLRRFADQKLTLADAVGLDLMARRKTTTCWSTDHHLSLGGVRIAIHA